MAAVRALFEGRVRVGGGRGRVGVLVQALVGAGFRVSGADSEGYRWLATERAKFMNGRYMGVNWDVDQLAEREKEIVDKGLLLMELQGTFGAQQFEK